MSTVQTQSKVTLTSGEVWHSSESYDALTTRLRAFVHPHMPVKVIVALQEREITVNRSAVELIEPV